MDSIAPRRIPRRTSFYKLFALMILAAGIGTSCAGWWQTKQALELRSDELLDDMASRTADVMDERLRRYVELMENFQGFASAKQDMTRQEFHAYFVGLHVEQQFQGVRAIQYSKFISEQQKNRLIGIVRADASMVKGGYPEFNIFPESDRQDHLPVIYSEPFDDHKASLGFDELAVQEERVESEEAFGNGSAAMSAPVTLPEGGLGVKVRLPIYGPSSSPEGRLRKQRPYDGLIIGVFRALSLMQEILPPTTREYRVRVQDIGSVNARAVQDFQSRTLYDSQSMSTSFEPAAGDSRVHVRMESGRIWAIVVARAHTDFRVAPLPLAILLGGMVASLALSAMVFAIATRYNVAASIAREWAHEARELAERLSTVIESSADGIVTTDGQGCIVTVNRAFLALLGATHEEVETRPLTDFVQDADRLLLLSQTGSQWVHESVAIGKTARIPVDISFNAMNLGKAKDFVCIVRDASQRRKNEAEIRHRAHHDSLTGLPNRALLNDRLNIAFDLARRENHALALLFLDLDHFKEINDGLGHEAGDEVLSEVAKRLLSVVRASDTVARLGGDEFVVLLPAMTSASHCETVCRKLLDSLQADLVVKGVPLRVTFSIGAAVFPDHAQDIDSLMRYADEAMYVAKRSGRNGYQLHAPQAAAQSASP